MMPNMLVITEMITILKVHETFISLLMWRPDLPILSYHALLKPIQANTSFSNEAVRHGEEKLQVHASDIMNRAPQRDEHKPQVTTIRTRFELYVDLLD